MVAAAAAAVVVVVVVVVLAVLMALVVLLMMVVVVVVAVAIVVVFHVLFCFHCCRCCCSLSFCGGVSCNHAAVNLSQDSDHQEIEWRRGIDCVPATPEQRRRWSVPAGCPHFRFSQVAVSSQMEDGGMWEVYHSSFTARSHSIHPWFVVHQRVFEALSRKMYKLRSLSADCAKLLSPSWA